MSELPPPGWTAEKTAFEIGMEKHLSPAVLKSPVSHSHLYSMMGQLLDAFGDLRKAINEINERPVLEYVGVWDQKKVYASGKFVTDGGSLWHSKRASVGERPGGSGDAWTLAVKKGKDAR